MHPWPFIYYNKCTLEVDKESFFACLWRCLKFEFFDVEISMALLHNQVSLASRLPARLVHDELGSLLRRASHSGLFQTSWLKAECDWRRLNDVCKMWPVQLHHQALFRIGQRFLENSSEKCKGDGIHTNCEGQGYMWIVSECTPSSTQYTHSMEMWKKSTLDYNTKACPTAEHKPARLWRVIQLSNQDLRAVNSAGQEHAWGYAKAQIMYREPV